MRARPGRLLPSVIVGGLLASGLALGAGIAAGAEKTTCLDAAGQTRDVTALLDDVKVVDGKCVATSLTVVLSDLLANAPVVPAPVAVTTTTTAPPTTTTTPKAVETTTAAPVGGDGVKGGGAGGVRPAVNGPAPAALGAPAPLAAGGPVGALPALPPLGGIAPAGLATNLFAANSYDPGLLFGSPLGNAASALFSPKADSDVTTVSQAQVLPTAASSGYGTPATIGVIILACLIGFAVRHRVISRMKAREVPAEEYRPRHAAPELADADSEVAGEPVPDDARTLVVLTQR